MKGGGEKVADHVARALEESAAPGDQQDHKREELQSGQQFPAGGKLALPPALLESFAWSVFRCAGPGPPWSRHLSIQNSIQYPNVIAPARSKTAGYAESTPARKASAVSILIAKESERSLHLRVQPAEHGERYIQ